MCGAEGVLCIGPIGLQNEFTYAFVYNGKTYVTGDGLSGTLAEFSEKVKETYDDSLFGQQYAAAIVFIKEWARIEIAKKHA